MRLRRLITAVLTGFAFLAPAAAEPLVHAHPALWHVKSPQGEVYLLGSIHLLPKTIDWHTGAIKAAMARADVFVFEVSEDARSQSELRDLVLRLGELPPGQSLRDMLPAPAQGDFDAALAKAHLPLAVADREKPWLVSLQLLLAEGTAKHYSPDAGVDRAVMGIAEAGHKPMRYFETIEQQIKLLAGSDDKVQLAEFVSDLKDYKKDDDDLGPLIDAWSKGQAAKLGELMNKELSDQPEVKAALLTDRNKRWVSQIQTMLTEKRIFFITVGAGHLSGPDSVPALLRAAGYKVDGP